MSGELFKKLPFVGKPLVDEHHKGVGPETPWTLVLPNPHARLEILREEALKILTDVTGVRWVQSSQGCFETFIAFKDSPYSSSWDDVMTNSAELRDFLSAAAKVSCSKATGCLWTALAVAGCDRYSRFAVRVGCQFIDLSWTGNFSKALQEVQTYCSDVGGLAREGAQRFQREIQRGGIVPHSVLDEYIDLNLKNRVGQPQS